MDTEIWKLVRDYEEYYEISNHGRLRILERMVMGKSGKIQIKKAKFARPRMTSNGYIMNAFNVNNHVKSFLRHRLVAQAFIPNPDDLPEINHLDGNKLNCHVSNLEWCTSSHNKQHAIKNGLTPIGENHYKASLTNNQVVEIRALNHQYIDRVIAKMYGVSRKTINNLRLNKTYSYV